MREDILFSTYNARHSEPEDVAKSFICSDYFYQLIKNNNSVILGARGCGKTTLMKMLTLPALYNWKNPRAQEIRNSLPFYSIFIPTDVYWDVKTNALNKLFTGKENIAVLLSEFSVSTNVFIALCDTFSNILKYEITEVNFDLEKSLCKEMIESWKLEKVIPELVYVKEALYKRIDKVNQLIQKLLFNNSFETHDFEDFFYLKFESSVEMLITSFKRIYNIGESKRWAFCFDELEFAPLWLQVKLFKSLRSRSHNVLYKLSASPILSKDLETLLSSDYRATAVNDFSLIRIFNTSSDKDFSKELIESVVKEKRSDLDYKSFFGSNDLYNMSRQPSSGTVNEFYVKMKSLVKKDISFEEFLISKGIDPKDPRPVSELQKSTIFRKIKPIVYFRDFFIKKTTNTDANRRGRKSAGDLYYGIEMLIEVCDGNPRWLKGIINSILVKSKEKSYAEPAVQYEVLRTTAEKFRSMVNNLPHRIESSSITMSQLIDFIGLGFKDSVLGASFKMDPFSIFKVDSKLVDSSEIKNLIEIGVGQGVFILQDPNIDSFDIEVEGKKFKLSYMLHILYNLPIRRYKVVSLSTLMAPSNRTVEREKESGSNQFKMGF